MGLRINDIAPDFPADSTEGQIRFHDSIRDEEVERRYGPFDGKLPRLRYIRRSEQV